ncbi:hypothetical protein HYD71_03295 [Mycoplasmopsis bovis]|nr:hypothetical protein [Mycoplasmopsis bovis]QQH49583.1 hypothetical protein HYD71_03295 [Mycoplasmopsis bovis]
MDWRGRSPKKGNKVLRTNKKTKSKMMKILEWIFKWNDINKRRFDNENK